MLLIHLAGNRPLNNVSYVPPGDYLEKEKNRRTNNRYLIFDRTPGSAKNYQFRTNQYSSSFSPSLTISISPLVQSIMAEGVVLP